MFTIVIDREHARRVAVEYLAKTLIITKQYARPDVIESYKAVIKDAANLIELESIEEQYNRAWPNDVKWSDQ